METLREQDEVTQLRCRVSELETALADAQEDLRLTRAWVRLVCREHAERVAGAAPPVLLPDALPAEKARTGQS